MSGAIMLWCAQLAAAAAGLLVGRRLPACLLLVLGGACLLLAAREGSEPRRLEVVHQHAAYVGNNVEQKDFPIEATEAPGWQWAAIGALFCGVLGLAALTRLPRAGAFAWPLLIGWSGTALALALEKLAAPAEAVVLRLQGSVWLAAIVAAVAVARDRPTVLAYALTLLVLVTALWAPAAVFGTLATQHAWGTSLDVHSIEFCAHPLARTPLTLEAGSTRQLWYLLWAPLLIVFPLLTWLSAGGFGFLLLMAQREAQRRQGTRPTR